MMIALAIVGILSTIAVLSVQRTRRRLSAERAMAELRGKIGEAQAIAAIAGSRMNTPRLVNNCTTAGVFPNGVAVTLLTPTTVEIPLGLTPIGNALRVDCEIVDLTALTNGSAPLPPVGTLTAPATPRPFMFSPSGRVIWAGIPPPDPTVLFTFTPVGGARPFGFRILTSGVMCQSNTLPAPPAPLCDQDL